MGYLVMKANWMRVILLGILLLAITPCPADAVPSWSNGLTMRLTLNHMGTKKEEHIAIKALRLEGPWAGPRDRLIDTSNLGDYQLAVEDPATNEILYSRGFNSAFDPSDTWSSVIYSLRFPAPTRSVAVYIKVRNADNVGFHDLWHTLIDPSDKSIDKTPIPAGDVTSLLNSGSTNERIDLSIIGDGYSMRERGKFIDDAKRATGYLFSTAPYSDHRAAFNVRAIFVPSQSSGILDPFSGVYVHSALGLSYGFNGIERDIGTLDDTILREAAAVAPYEFLLVITNSKRYGGEGDLQRQSVVAIDSRFARYLVLHEFSHQFAGLDDEYYLLAKCSSEAKVEPWRPNVTAHAGRKSLKWADLLSPSMAVPSGWNKKQYEDYDTAFANKYFAMRNAGIPDSEVDAYIAESVSHEIKMVDSEPLADQVGAFEGASNEACGLYRPETDCMMFTINPDRFCRVCARAIRRAIATYAYE
jgi:hypothetical protein